MEESKAKKGVMKGKCRKIVRNYTRQIKCARLDQLKRKRRKVYSDREKYFQALLNGETSTQIRQLQHEVKSPPSKE